LFELKDFIKSHPFFQILIAVLFISVFAQIEVVLPTNQGGIPVTGQTFAVLLVGYFLGIRKGMSAILFYLIFGAIGLPVFAGGAGGFEVFFGNSAGFLFGFIFGAASTGYFGEKGWGKDFFKCLLGMVVGTSVIIFFGLLFLTVKYDFWTALKYGFYPFVWGAIIKSFLGAMIPPIYHNFIKTK
jgi:biotin transport system substrate-specific component